MPPDPRFDPDNPELTEAQRLVLVAAREGKVTKLSALAEEERILDADWLADLVTLPEGDPRIHRRGLWVQGAGIAGQLDLENARIPRGLGLLRCTLLEGLNLRGTITRTIDLGGSTVKNGLWADRLNVQGNLFLRRGFTAEGEVFLRGAEVGGNFECDGGSLVNPKGNALDADTVKVKGGVFLRQGFKAKGVVRLLGAEIGGNLDCDRGSLVNPEGNALNADGITVRGGILLREGFKAEGGVDFCHARVGVLADSPDSWPGGGKTRIDGFVYGALSQPGPIEQRLNWLKESWTDGYRPQPYEQLAKVLKAAGHEREARQVQIAKNDRRRAEANLSPVHKAWLWLVKHLAGYGYEPWRALKWMALAVGLGLMVFANAYEWDRMRPTKERVYLDPCYRADNGACGSWETKSLRFTNASIRLPADYPAFNGFIYALDTFVPLVDLHQESYWAPRDGVFRGYLWMHIAAGWFLSTILVAGLTGLLKKD